MRRPIPAALLILALALASCDGRGETAMPDRPDAAPTGKPARAASTLPGVECPALHLEPQPLPPMNIPRSGHVTFCLGQEILVVGGHTTGFIPTATAELFDGDEWTTISTIYEHDDPLALRLTTGQVLVAGGHERHLGIGQTFPAEMYEPETQTFRGFGCLEQKRAFGCGVELDSGCVAIAGNWYRGDTIELFDGRKFFNFARNTSAQRAAPFMIRSAADDALVLGGLGIRGDSLFSPVVDRLKGEPFHVPLLETWHPLPYLQCGYSGADYFIGDEAQGVYASLLPVEDLDGHIALACVRDTVFSLMPTACPVPTEGPWGRIIYSSPPLADHDRRMAYLSAYSLDRRLYILAVNYGRALDGGEATLTLYYTDPQPRLGLAPPVLTADGNLLTAGGSFDDNFTPSANVCMLHVNGDGPALKASRPAWHWMLAGLLAALLAAAAALAARRRHTTRPTQTDTPEPMPEPSPQDNGTQLMAQISRLMEEEKLYLNSELKLSDVAVLLGTNSRYVADCIKRCHDCSFTLFVNQYRVEHAKQLMRQQPDAKVSMVAFDSGFATDTSFYRTFKAITGTTPKEWMKQND